MTNENAPSLTRVPGVDGTELVTDPGEWGGDEPISYTRQWQRCDQSGETCRLVRSGDSYPLRSADAGSRLRGVVVARNAGGSNAAHSELTDVLQVAQPEAVTPPTLDGTSQAGAVLTADPPTWWGTGPLTIAYQWQRCDQDGGDCGDISNATDAVYELGEGDVAKRIRLVAVAENEAGEDMAVSAPSASVTAPDEEADELALAPGSHVGLSGETEVGETLTVDEGEWEHTAPIDFSYDWERCALDDDECEPIADAAEAAYTLTSADAGAFVRVLVTATDGEQSEYVTATTKQSIHAVGGPANTDSPSILGDPLEGTTLAASAGAWDVTAPVAYAFQWQTCDPDDPDECATIEDATEPTYTPQAGDVGDAVRVAVTATDAQGQTTAVSAPTAGVAAASPSAMESPSISGRAREGEQLTAADGSWQGVGPLSYSHQWQRCEAAGEACADIQGATGATFVLGAGDVGSTVRVVVTASNGLGSDAQASDPTPPVTSDALPAPEGPPVISGAPNVGALVTSTAGTWTGEGPITYAYEWQACQDTLGQWCVARTSGASYVASLEDVGLWLRVRVTATNAAGAVDAFSDMTAPVATSEPQNAAPLRNHSAPSISGGLNAGATLTASPGSWTAGSAVTYVYQWRRCDAVGGHCQNLDGATQAAHALTAGDVGRTLRVTVRASAGGTTGYATSDATAKVKPDPPTSMSLPDVGGVAVDGAALIATTGTWTGQDVTFTYQWQRCDQAGETCADIDGATAQEYDLGADDVGATHRVRVAAANDDGSATAVSAPGSVVAPRAPENDESPSVSGQQIEGATLEATPGTWLGSGTLDYAYQWQRCTADSECADIAGATHAAYVLAAADIEQGVRVVVTAANAAGSADARSGLTDPIAAAAPPEIAGWSPEIYGFANDGQRLEGSAGMWAGLEPITYAYQWLACDAGGDDCEAIAGANGDVYTTTTGDIGSTLRLEVTATNPSGSTSTRSFATEIIAAAAPENVWQPWIDGEPRAGAILAAQPGGWSGSALTYAYQWRRCDEEGECTDIEAATGANYTVQTDDVTSRLAVLVSASNGLGTQSAVSEMIYIAGDAPESMAPPAISGPTVVGRTLTADEGEWTHEPEGYRYQWRRCNGTTCEDIDGARSSTYQLTQMDLGARLEVAVTAWTSADTEGTIATSARTGRITTVGNVSPPVLWGTPIVGESIGIWSLGDWVGSGDEWRYQWQRCEASGDGCSPIAGATDDNYWLADADVGQTIRLTVIAVTASGDLEATSEHSGIVVAPTRPVNTSAPTISADTRPGDTIYVEDPGTWEAMGSLDYEYSWLRCDADGKHCDDVADSDSYRLARADVAATIRVRVTATNGWGSVSAVSLPSALIAEPGPLANLTPPSVNDWIAPYYDGLYFYADQGTWDGPPDISDRWQRCDPLTADPVSGTMDCVDIPGPAGQVVDYTPTATDVGYRLRFKETASTPDESQTAYSSTTPAVVAGISVKQPGYTGVPVSGQTITAVGTADAGSGLPTSIGYRFYRLTDSWNFELLQEGHSPEYTLTDEDIGNQIYIDITATLWRHDHATDLFTRTASVTTSRVEGPPENDVLPQISGDATVGVTLEAAEGAWHGGFGELAHSYQWLRCNGGGDNCADIAGAEGTQFTLRADDVGGTVRVRETAGNGPVAGTATSQPTAPVAAAEAPVNLAPPTIDGDPVERHPISAGTGDWTGSEPMTFAYQWQVCEDDETSCEDIDEATEATFVPTDLEIDGRLRVKVTATNAAGDELGTSVLTAAVVPAPAPQNVEPPSLATLGSPSPGAFVSTDGGVWQDADEVDLNYAWQRCDLSGASCADIDAAAESDYEIAPADVGSRLRVAVTAVTGSGDTTATSELSDPVAASATSELDRVVFLNYDRDTIYTATRDGSDVRTVAACGDLPSPPADGACELRRPRISPTGAMIAVQARVPGPGDDEEHVFVMDADGSEIRDVGPGAEPAWTPDPSELLISRTSASASATSMHVFRIDIADRNTGDAVQVTHGSGEQRWPRLSPDGQMLTYTDRAADENESSLYVASASGAKPVRLDLGTVVADPNNPQFSQDSRQVIFTGRDTDPVHPMVSESRSVWTVGIDGRGLHRITPRSADDYGPAEYDPVTDTIIVARRTMVITSFGWGISVTAGPPSIWAFSFEGLFGHFFLRAPYPTADWKGELDVSNQVAFAATGDTAEKMAKQIYREQRLGQVGQYAEEAEKALERRGAAALTQAKLKYLRKWVRRAHVIDVILEALINPDSTACEAGPYNERVGGWFEDSAETLNRVAHASAGTHRGLLNHLRHDYDALKAVNAEAADKKEDFSDSDPCQMPFMVAEQVSARLLKAVAESMRYLARLAATDARTSDAGFTLQTVGKKGCDQAGALTRKLRNNKIDRKYVVYWAPPPEEVGDGGVLYVGISRNLYTRCQKHRSNSDHPTRRRLKTLNLPPLTRRNALNVEEALISHWGPQRETPTVPGPNSPSFGQLTNIYHAIQPRLYKHPDYCERLLVGQTILKTQPGESYGRYASAFFTQGLRCVGTGH